MRNTGNPQREKLKQLELYFKWGELKSRGLHPEHPKSVLHFNVSHDVHFKNGYEWLHKVGVMLQPKMAVSAAGK